MNYVQNHINLDAIKDALVDKDRRQTRATELGFVWTPGEALLTFAMSEDFVRDAASRPNVAAILVDSSVTMSSPLPEGSPEIFHVENVRLNFFRLHNSLRSSMRFAPTMIAASSSIHPTAVIDEVGVVIGERCIVEPGVSIRPGTVIGNDCVIRAGAHLGTDALDIKDDEDGNPLMTDHLGSVVIEDFVEIGHNAIVDRSIFRQTATVVGEYTKVGCLSMISHGVRVGKRNKVTAGVMICGSTVVGDDNWFGPGAIVSNLLKLGSRNYVALGANVLSDLEDEWKVVGTRVFKDRKLF